MKLYLIRHGQTAWNAENRIQGHLGVPLDEVGLEQAEQIGVRMQQIGVRPQKIFTSDLVRAVQTAEIIARHLHAPVETLLGLRERAWGEWEGITGAEIRERYPMTREERSHFVPPGAESTSELWQRVRETWQTLLEQGVEDLVIVGHGGSLRVMLCEAMAASETTYRRLHLDNASLSIVEVSGNRTTILLMNG
jgi:broad specificity phosphatase PhoE